MAKKTGADGGTRRLTSPKKKRPGIHAKKKRSVHKSSTRWKKPSRGQGG